MAQPSLTRILILGASGKTGKLVITEALKRNIPVTGLVRNTKSLDAAPGLTIVEGTPLELADIERAIIATKERPSVIISTLGQTRKSGNPWSAPTSPPRFMADAMRNAVASAKKFGMEKVVVMSMFGAGKSFGNLNFLMRGVMKWSNMAQTVEDHNLVDEIVKSCGLNFVLVRPAMLKIGSAATVKEVGDEGDNATFMPSIQFEAVARFLVDAATSSTWNGRTPVICA